MTGNIESRLRKLEMAAVTRRMPGLMICYKQPNGTLIDQLTGEVVEPGTDFFGLKLILTCLPEDYQEIKDGQFEGAESVLSVPSRHLEPAEWAAMVDAQLKKRDALLPPKLARPEPQIIVKPAPPPLSDYEKRSIEFERIIETNKMLENRQRRLYYK